MIRERRWSIQRGSEAARLRTRAAALVLGLTAVAGCGNWVSTDDLDFAYLGPIALTVNDAGDPLILLLVCNEPVSEVEVIYGLDGPTKKSGGNGDVGTWEAKSPLALGRHELNLIEPGDEWVSHPAESLISPWSYIVTGRNDDGETASVYARSAVIAKLAPGDVLVGSEIAESRAEFEKRKCSDPPPSMISDR